MSWLNFNESLNTIKGQLSNFASGVLTEGIVNITEDDHSSTDNKIEERNGDRDNELPAEVPARHVDSDTSWSWQPTCAEKEDDTNTTVLGLRNRIERLETEKKDLIVSLEQLDLDCQQTTDKLVTLKDNLQSDYNELRAGFERLQKEYGDVLIENMEKTRQIEEMKQDGASKREENQMLAKKVAVGERDAPHLDDEHLKREIEDLMDRNRTLVAQNEQLQPLRDQLRARELELDSLRRTHGELECRHEEQLRTEYESVKQSRDARDGLSAEKERLSRDLEGLKRENDQLRISNETLSGMKADMHKRYMNIITECVEDLVCAPVEPPPSVLAPITPDDYSQLSEFVGKVDALLEILLGFKGKTEALERQLGDVAQEKNNAVAEKNFEIERLLRNSEILSQEVITKTQTIKEYEDECAELMKNNDLLISELQNYKNGSGGLQTISETNEDSVLMLESQVEAANKRIQELEGVVTDLENAKQETNLETQTELEYMKKQLNVMGQELDRSTRNYQRLEGDWDGLKSTLERTKVDYETAEYKYTEANVGMETLKEENEECKTKNRKLESLNFDLEERIELLQNVVDEEKHKVQLELESNSQKEVQIRSLVEKLQNSKMCETGLKLQVDTIYKELQTVVEAKQGLEAKCEAARSSLETVQSELERAKAEHIALQLKLYDSIEEADSELPNKLETIEQQVAELSTSRNELIALIMAKHQENVQYHNEIQRLTPLLSAETEKVRHLELQLREALTEGSDAAKQTQEMEKLADQNGFLREKCEVLAQNLLEEQARLQKAVSERQTASEKEQALSKELDRLRVHLVEIEDSYTQELLQAEQKNKEMRTKVNEIERREKDSSSIYTSVSIRANQQVETLQTQLQLVTNQRDELRARVSDLEDDINRQTAALTNLQLVLEQFQKDREKDVHQETERVRRQIGVERQVQQEMQREMDSLRSQLEESKQGLQAASRLSDQLEKAKQQTTALKSEVTNLQEQLQITEKRHKDVASQNEAKIDKMLIKNLVIGYVTSSAADQNQILKIIATVLDFNQKESEKVHLNSRSPSQQGGWLSSILHPANSHHDSNNQQSLAEAFVRFLENESKPKVLPNLLTSSTHARNESSTASSLNTTPRQSPLVLSEVVLPTFTDFGKNRNSSSILKDVLKDNSY